MSVPPPLTSFDSAAIGYRFTLRYQPSDGRTQGTVILAPPFAEEMNRCRRMTALAARRLAALGWRVHVRDLLGCGDSSGDFGDATWQTWIDDLIAMVDEVPDDEPLWLWGVRAGALLIPAMAARRPDANVLLWQPALSGKTVLTQFLRLRTTAAVIGGKSRIDGKALRASLLAGRPEEIAGYTVSPALASGLEQATLSLPEQFRGNVVWLEVALSEPADLAPAGEALRNHWRSRGLALEGQAVIGELFWQTQETTECESLLKMTEEAVCRSQNASPAANRGAKTVHASAPEWGAAEREVPATLFATPRKG